MSREELAQYLADTMTTLVRGRSVRRGRGVIATTSGYIGGRTQNPTQEQVSSGGTGHTEAVQVTYDPSKVSYQALLETFWRNVDAVDGGGPFCDRGSQ